MKKWGRIIQFVLLVAIALIFTLDTLSHSNLLNSLQAESIPHLQYQKNVQLGTTNVALGGGGYVTGIYLHPRVRDLVYIRTDVGGFYRWDSQNQRWIPLNERFTLDDSNYFGGESLALDPNNPNIVYIAAGKYVQNKGTIFKSTDQGNTWTKLNLDLPMGGNIRKRWVGQRLVVSPHNSNLLFFGSRRDGLWKSTNAGQTWAKVTRLAVESQRDIGIPSLIFDPITPNRLYVNVFGDGIYQSDNLGETWRKLPNSPKSANQLAINDKGILYVTSSESPGVSQWINHTWQDITPEKSKHSFNAISINPRNQTEILVSSGERTDTKIYHSLDGGKTWKALQRQINNTVPWWRGILLRQPSISAIRFDPQVPGRVWLTDWFGIWRTDKINTNPVTWTNYQQGHEELVTFALVSPPEGALLISGVADVEGFYHDRGLDHFPSRGMGLANQRDPLQDTYSIAYCEKNPLQMVRVGGRRWNSTYTGATSQDGGKTWYAFAEFPNRMPVRVAMSATNPNLFVVTLSKGQPIRTTNGGKTWEAVAGLPNAPDGPWNWSQSLAADAVEGETFYYYHREKFYRSHNGGKDFEVVNDSLPRENWHSVKTIPGEVWVSLDRKGLYRSRDKGDSFEKIAKVEQAYLFAFGKAIARSKVPALYLYGKIEGMGAGIFQSLDLGKTWTRFGHPQLPIGNEPNVMEASKQKPSLVFIGTNGRGIYYGTS